MRDLAATFKALADETRLSILGLIFLRGEICVCDVEGSLGITQSKASRHLRYIRNAGLLEDRREGVWMHYRIPGDLDPKSKLVLDALRAVIPEATMSELREALELWFAKKCKSCVEPAAEPHSKPEPERPAPRR
jgi:ArsR family transcriptional regulator